jgi:hypothetical protein
MMHGAPCEWDAFALELGSPVYTDGSAVHVQHTEIAQAGAAVFQVDSAGQHRVIQARIPPEWPVSAVTAEFLAIDLAARALATPYNANPEAPLTEVYIDCQAVVTALRDPVPYYRSYRAKFAGDFKHPHIKKPIPVKVKAHQAEILARANNQYDKWYGNDKADRFADEARANLGKAAKDYVQEFSVRTRVLARVADALAAAMPQLHTLPKRDKPPPIAHPSSSHRWVWHETSWCCLECGRTVRRRGPAVLKSPCMGPPAGRPRRILSIGCTVA